MSDGTLRFLAIVVALMTRPAGSLLVVEEVDLAGCDRQPKALRRKWDLNSHG